ncbi:FAD-dependent oxidoreductase [Raoultibacter phocaeensis]|uniref:FAD-dependent oxidoreductase n=1 Tax=Raoultibacter phocaeensis TaxID=2479841 RepID=UPI00111BBB85|nr:FAD-dependent oxidoreductase [Raoultibacter phocaeensis]
MERREFFKLAGTSAAVLALGGALFGCETDGTASSAAETTGENALAQTPPISFSKEVDVLIVGSGIAGLSAAMDPAEQNRSVLIADKRDLIGGESFEANGLFFVSGTSIQKAAGIEKSAEDAWKERKAELEEEGDANNLRFKQNLIMAQTEWVDRVARDYGAQFADPREYSIEGAADSVVIPKKGIGDMESVMAPLKDGLSSKGVTFELGMRASAFILDGQNKPAGMRFCAEQTGKTLDVKAKRIVIATGGYSANQELVGANIPDQATIGCLTVYATGDGISLCTAIGGKTADLDQAASLIGDIPEASSWGMFGPTVALSPYGTRFAREDQVGASANACALQELGFWWIVFDKQLSEGLLSRSIASVTSKQKKRLIGPFDSLDDLAEALKVPADTLSETLEAYHRSVDEKKDGEFGRTAHIKQLEAPYYALKQFPVRHKTLGGMQTDDTGKLTGAQTSSENVYCCGSAAAESVNGLASNAAFGMLVGKAIADALAESDQTESESAS